MKVYRKAVPPQKNEANPVNDPKVVQSEVTGWTALFESQNYNIAADRFEAVWDVYLKANVVDMGTFQKWTWARAVHLQGVLGEPAASARSLTLAEEAINRGGKSSWFNRLRASLNRSRNQQQTGRFDDSAEYAVSLVRTFNDFLEQVGSTDRFDKHMQFIRDSLSSDKHAQFCDGLEKLGSLLGYKATRPKGNAAADNRWRGIFGNDREVITFEAKVEHSDGKEVTPTHMGQAHNQYNRGLTEFSQSGYTVRGTLATHLTKVDAAAKSAAGPIRIIAKDALLELLQRVQTILSVYRDGWSPDDVAVSHIAAEKIYPKIPPAGWLIRALDKQALFISSADLLKE